MHSPLHLDTHVLTSHDKIGELRIYGSNIIAQIYR